MRLFIAVPVSDEVRREAGALIGRLSGAGADVKWTEPENLHWTLHFFGETPDSKVAEIESLLKDAAHGVAPFELKLGAAGAFPNERQPRIVWLGLEHGEPSLQVLAEKVRDRVRRAGFAVEERPFKAHLTLGRVRGLKRIKALGAELANVSGACAMTADRLELIRSWLGPKGPKYESVASAALEAR